MKFKAVVLVGLRGDHSDPESETVKKSLIDLNFPVQKIRVEKTYEIVVDCPTKKDAESLVRLMCSRLLANPTKDEYSLQVEPVGNATKS